MNISEAESAIRAILATIEDSHLPEPRQDEHTPNLYWFGGCGYHAGTAQRDGAVEPDVHRNFGLTDLFAREKMARIDAELIKKEGLS